MSAVWTAVSTFLNNILVLIAGGTIGEETVQGLVPWIVANGTVAIFVLAIPLVSFAVVFYMCDKCVTYRLPSPRVISE